MTQILLISGTRPEIIKLAPVYHALRQASWAKVRWLHTSQHEAMADQILDCFGIVPDIVLQRDGTSLAEFGLGCRRQLDVALAAEDPALVIVQGDTESAFLGALAAFYRRVPIAHVEAGMRTNDLARPFPEEGLRQMIGRIAQFHFSATPLSGKALQSEGVAEHRIHTTGNTVVDAQQWTCREKGVRRRTSGRGHLLVTFHRRESWGPGVAGICRAIATIAAERPEMQVLFPVHLNPVIQGPVQQLLGQLPNVKLVAPLGYVEMQQALSDAWVVLTDSGGLQEEAPTFGVPVLVLREETERPEAVDAGCALLIGVGEQRILAELRRLLDEPRAHSRMAAVRSPFGDGQAAARITSALGAVFAPKALQFAVA